MRKIILTALNTRHTHSALALAYLKAFWEKVPGRQELEIQEFDLNQTNESIIAELVLQKPDIIAFSVYIWSVSRTLVIAGALKAALPDVTIILGGPEVSFNSEQILQQNNCIDNIVRGEGEATFAELLESLLANNPVEKIRGITMRNDNQIIANEDRELIDDLDIIPSPFRNGIYKEVHSFTYYEASRGCPSKCSYCLSSVQGPVRNHSLTRVKQDLDWFFSSSYRQVRFADRTFNFDRQRAREIITYIRLHNHRNINFHFEIQADFLSEDIIDLLAEAPEGMFHLEIGIQSTNPDALTSVNRYFDLEKLTDRIHQLKKRTGCHLHLDILGGLPGDTLADFYQSLDDVWNMMPHSIQISLVKVLKGTPLEKQLATNEFFAMPDPPYTILRSRWLACDAAIKIQDIGKLVEGLHNCDRFPATLRFCVEHFFAGRCSSFFASLSDWWRKNKLLFFNFSPEIIAGRLKDFVTFLHYERQEGIDNIAMRKCTTLLTHELRMTQKVPAGEQGPMPDFAPSLARHSLRPVQGLKAFWYDFDPRTVSIAKNDSVSPYPLVYLFERDLSLSPTIEVAALTLPEAFLFAAVQQRIPLDTVESTWKNTYPGHECPDFSLLVEKLCQSGLLYEPAKKRLRQEEA
jgi:radical SAM superfamily enzyme YgiQ (UPF0313 family)